MHSASMTQILIATEPFFTTLGAFAYFFLQGMH
jgi:drug/metabolite transporter (DMT)-like permease